jgi:phosphatidylinositol dimannoside acyltransferase
MIPSATVVRLAVRLLRVAPTEAVRSLARAMGAAGFTLARARRRTLLENQAHLSPNATPATRRRLARRTMMNLLDASVDLFRLPALGADEFQALVAVEGKQHLDQAVAMQRGVIVVTAHLGPYELAGAWLAHSGYAVHAMVEDIDPDTNAALAMYREATGMKLFSRTGGVRTTLRLLRDRKIVLLVADRVVGAGTEGLDVPFGAGRRAVPTGPAALALATGAPIIVGHIARNPSGATRYLVHMDAPIVPESTGDAHLDRERLTQQIAARVADAVQAHADQWFVFQPEWTS